MPAKNKSSKTAHVLNLIAGEEAPAATPQELPVTPEKHGQVTPILEVARENDDAISSSIFEALWEDDFASEKNGDAPAAEPPVKAAVPAVETPAAEIPPIPAVEKPVAPAVKPAGTAPDSFEYCNITQKLVEEKAEKYMKLLNMCQCRHCVADVKALALTHLPPHYAVVQQDGSLPVMALYEERLDAEITAQLMSACRVVQEKPRH